MKKNIFIYLLITDTNLKGIKKIANLEYFSTSDEFQLIHLISFTGAVVIKSDRTIFHDIGVERLTCCVRDFMAFF